MSPASATFTISARTVVCLALLLYCASIFTLAIFPSDDITWLEYMIALLSVFAGIGLVLRMTPWHAPGVDYAYLVTAFIGMVTLMSFDWDAPDPKYSKTRVTLLLLTGIIGAIGAHIAQDREDARAT